jgi:hypothetical protein
MKLCLTIISACVLLHSAQNLRAQAPLRITDIASSNGHIEITWENGLPPFQIIETALLNTNSGVVIASGAFTNRSATLNSTARTRGFYIIKALGPPATETAEYRITFSNNWSNENHPTMFPDNAHYSTFIGAAHNANVSFWNPGITATTGIRNMAETGSNSVLGNEITTAVSAGNSTGNFTLSSPRTFSQEFPLATIVAMIAPSPDWFIGVHDYALFDGTNWVDDVTVELFPYDAGTDSGTTYKAPNQPTPSPTNIFRILGAPFLNNDELRPLGTFRFERVDQP